jgi:hypothetical protein
VGDDRDRDDKNTPDWARVRTNVLLAVGVAGLAARFVLAALSIGCDDINLWLGHGEGVATHGLIHTYRHRQLFNHPPLMGYWSGFAYQHFQANLHAFSWAIKAPGLLVELVAAVLVYRIAAKRGPVAGALTFAAYAWSPALLLVAGYHGSTDCAYAGLCLLSVYLLEETNRPFWAGAALALALNVKLMPLFLIPPLLAACRTSKRAARFAAGLALGVVPFIPILLKAPRSVYRNMIQYNSVPDDWGLSAFFNYARASGKFASIVAPIAAKYVPNGRYVIAAAVLAVAVTAVIRPRWSGHELGALAWSCFLVCTPGFGVQYSVCVLPLLFVVDVRRAAIYSLFAAVLIAGVYFARGIPGIPIRVYTTSPYPPLAVLFGIMAWLTLIGFVNATFVRRALAR